MDSGATTPTSVGDSPDLSSRVVSASDGSEPKRVQWRQNLTYQLEGTPEGSMKSPLAPGNQMPIQVSPASTLAPTPTDRKDSAVLSAGEVHGPSSNSLRLSRPLNKSPRRVASAGSLQQPDAQTNEIVHERNLLTKKMEQLKMEVKNLQSSNLAFSAANEAKSTAAPAGPSTTMPDETDVQSPHSGSSKPPVYPDGFTRASTRVDSSFGRKLLGMVARLFVIAIFFFVGGLYFAAPEQLSLRLQLRWPPAIPTVSRLVPELSTLIWQPALSVGLVSSAASVAPHSAGTPAPANDTGEELRRKIMQDAMVMELSAALQSCELMQATSQCSSSVTEELSEAAAALEQCTNDLTILSHEIEACERHIGQKGAAPPMAPAKEESLEEWEMAQRMKASCTRKVELLEASHAVVVSKLRRALKAEVERVGELQNSKQAKKWQARGSDIIFMFLGGCIAFLVHGLYTQVMKPPVPVSKKDSPRTELPQSPSVTEAENPRLPVIPAAASVNALTGDRNTERVEMQPATPRSSPQEPQSVMNYIFASCGMS